MSALKRTLRSLILIEIFLWILTFVAILNEAHLLPRELMEWQFNESRKPKSPFEKFVPYLDIPFLVCLVVSWVGLWRIWRPAFFLYPGLWMAGLVLSLFHGASVIDPISSTLWDLTALTGGMIISLLLFTPLRGEFLSRKKP